MVNFIDIFAGCGGLSEGFKSLPQYRMLAAVEWEKHQVENLRNRLRTRWDYQDAEQRVIQFDIQRTDELLNGWVDDAEYGTHTGLNYLVGEENVDLIIGGPPCQAYSLAARVGYGNQMQNDYRNFLFESYMRLVKRYEPEFFVFENVLGMLSAKVGEEGIAVTDLIRADIEAAGYTIIDDLRKYAIFDLSEYGIPQRRKRVIIIGVKTENYDNPQLLLRDLYTEILPTYKEEELTVRDAIGDLPALYPLNQVELIDGKKFSHSFGERAVFNHIPRYHNQRDIEIFRILARDIERGENRFTKTESLRQLYTEMTGRQSNIHKYHVLRLDEPSNTIPAHLHKDGLRHIHPDSAQARTITVREAARLQTFPDDYQFISNPGANYKMIGNAVPPKFAEKIAHALLSFFI